MAGEERESQEFPVAERVFPNPGVKPTIRIAYLVVGVVGVVLGVLLRMYAVQFTKALYDIALSSTVNSFRNLGLGMAILFSAYIVAHLIVIFAGYSVKEIVLSKEGIVFRRGRSPIVMERISNVEVVSGGRVLKLTGSTWEGKTVKKRVTWSYVGRKRWQEFKHDLQELESTY